MRAQSGRSRDPSSSTCASNIFMQLLVGTGLVLFGMVLAMLMSSLFHLTPPSSITVGQVQVPCQPPRLNDAQESEALIGTPLPPSPHPPHLPPPPPPSPPPSPSAAADVPAAASLADGCRYVFLDAGANIGMQTRKLFEADKVSGCLQTGDRHRCYKDLFTDAFGTIQQRRRPEWGVCAFLFEPNPVHTLRLKQLEAAYRKQGWRVWAFTETGVGDGDGEGVLYRDSDERPGDPWYKPGEHPMAISASTTRNHGRGGARVAIVDLARFMLEQVAPRRLPQQAPAGGEGGEPLAPPPAVILKMDTEGAEHKVVPHLALSGALCKANYVLVEYHFVLSHGSTVSTPPYQNLHYNLTSMMEGVPSCRNTTLIWGDDESGIGPRDRNLPLPT